MALELYLVILVNTLRRTPSPFGAAWLHTSYYPSSCLRSRSCRVACVDSIAPWQCGASSAALVEGSDSPHLSFTLRFLSATGFLSVASPLLGGRLCTCTCEARWTIGDRRQRPGLAEVLGTL